MNAVIKLAVLAVEELLGSFAEDGSGCNAVCQNALRSELNGHRAGQIYHPSLGCSIRTLEAGGDETHDRGYVDDASKSLQQHVLGDHLTDQEDTGEINFHDAIPLFGWELIDVHTVCYRVDAGIVDEDIDAPVNRDDVSDTGRDLDLVGDVHFHRHRTWNGFSETLGTSEIDVSTDDRCAVDGERVADGLADGTCGSGNERDLLAELNVHGRTELNNADDWVFDKCSESLKEASGGGSIDDSVIKCQAECQAVFGSERIV